MRLFKLELKRLLKLRRTQIIVMISIALSIIMALLPVTFERIYYVNEQGETIDLKGTAAIEYVKEARKDFQGEVTPEKIGNALQVYQNTVSEYGDPYEDDFPAVIYFEKILPITPFIMRLTEINMNPLTNVFVSPMDIKLDEAEHYYETARSHLKDIMQTEQKEYPSAQADAVKRYNKVAKPYQMYGYYPINAMEYIMLYIWLFAFLTITMLAPVFSDAYQTGADTILRSTMKGRFSLAVCKVLVSVLVCIITYIICIGIHIFVSDIMFGFDGLKTSMRLVFSACSLPNVTLGEMQLMLAVGYGISILALASATLYLSAKCNTPSIALTGAVIVCLLPWLLYLILDINWLSCLLPSGGFGLQNAFFSQLTAFNYVHIGEKSFWTPIVITVAALIELPFFLFGAVRTYCKHKLG